MTTPEQLAKWRGEAKSAFRSDYGSFLPENKAPYIEGYLRRCQETEQAIKDARKQALEEAIAICKAVCSPYPTDQGDGYNEGALDCEKKIKELLNDH